jgi:hypothetical protein
MTENGVDHLSLAFFDEANEVLAYPVEHRFYSLDRLRRRRVIAAFHRSDDDLQFVDNLKRN